MLKIKTHAQDVTATLLKKLDNSHLWYQCPTYNEHTLHTIKIENPSDLDIDHDVGVFRDLGHLTGNLHHSYTNVSTLTVGFCIPKLMKLR